MNIFLNCALSAELVFKFTLRLLSGGTPEDPACVHLVLYIQRKQLKMLRLPAGEKTSQYNSLQGSADCANPM